MEVRTLSEVITLLKNQKGLTLIEILITLALIGLVVGVVNQIYLTQFQSFKVTEEKAKLLKEAKEIQTNITNLAMESSGIIELKLDDVSYKEKDSLDDGTIIELVLNHPQYGNILISYDKIAQTLILNQDELSQDITGFQILSLGGVYKDAKSINIKLSLQSKRLRQTVNYETEFTLMFRNK